MTPEQFAYWLQGYVELQGSVPTDEQWQGIKDHLQAVFVKVTPQVHVAGPAHDLLARPGFLQEAVKKFNTPGLGPAVVTC